MIEVCGEDEVWMGRDGQLGPLMSRRVVIRTYGLRSWAVGEAPDLRPLPLARETELWIIGDAVEAAHAAYELGRIESDELEAMVAWALQ